MRLSVNPPPVDDLFGGRRDLLRVQKRNDSERMVGAAFDVLPSTGLAAHLNSYPRVYFKQFNNTAISNVLDDSTAWMQSSGWVPMITAVVGLFVTLGLAKYAFEVHCMGDGCCRAKGEGGGGGGGGSRPSEYDEDRHKCPRISAGTFIVLLIVYSAAVVAQMVYLGFLNADRISIQTNADQLRDVADAIFVNVRIGDTQIVAENEKMTYLYTHGIGDGYSSTLSLDLANSTTDLRQTVSFIQAVTAQVNRIDSDVAEKWTSSVRTYMFDWVVTAFALIPFSFVLFWMTAFDPLVWIWDGYKKTDTCRSCRAVTRAGWFQGIVLFTLMAFCAGTWWAFASPTHDLAVAAADICTKGPADVMTRYLTTSYSLTCVDPDSGPALERADYYRSLLVKAEATAVLAAAFEDARSASFAAVPERGWAFDNATALQTDLTATIALLDATRPYLLCNMTYDVGKAIADRVCHGPRGGLYVDAFGFAVSSMVSAMCMILILRFFVPQTSCRRSCANAWSKQAGGGSDPATQPLLPVLGSSGTGDIGRDSSSSNSRGL